jgi:hypothetical protein
MKVEEILAALGVEVDPAKASVVQEWNGKLSASENEAQTRLSEAQSKVQEAEALQRVIDDNIRTAGLTETNIAQLRANNASLSAANAQLITAVESIKSQGFDGITIPDLPKTNVQPSSDPMKELKETLMNGFGQIGQTINEMNRYQRVFGTAIPEDPATIADRAAKNRQSVHDYVEQTYKVSAKEYEIAQAKVQKEKDDYASQKIEAYKAEHPVTAGHPELGPGVPSNYPNIPKPRDVKDVRAFSQLSPMQKIQDAKARVTKEVQSRMSAA